MSPCSERTRPHTDGRLSCDGAAAGTALTAAAPLLRSPSWAPRRKRERPKSKPTENDPSHNRSLQSEKTRCSSQRLSTEGTARSHPDTHLRIAGTRHPERAQSSELAICAVHKTHENRPCAWARSHRGPQRFLSHHPQWASIFSNKPADSFDNAVKTATASAISFVFSAYACDGGVVGRQQLKRERVCMRAWRDAGNPARLSPALPRNSFYQKHSPCTNTRKQNESSSTSEQADRLSTLAPSSEGLRKHARFTATPKKTLAKSAPAPALACTSPYPSTYHP
jgi:hypothetical protein